MLYLLIQVLILTSCKDEVAEPAELSGDWQSEEIHVNGKLQEDISTSTWLLLKKNNVFARNYVVGTWSVDKGKLELIVDQSLNLKPLQYKVVDISETHLTLEIALTEREYYSLWGISSPEVEQLTVTEKYRRR